MRNIIINADGTRVVTDNTTLEQAKAEQIAILSAVCTEAIVARYPEFKQLNAAYSLFALEKGYPPIYDASKSLEVMGWVIACKAAYDACEATVIAATDNEAVYAVAFETPTV